MEEFYRSFAEEPSALDLLYRSLAKQPSELEAFRRQQEEERDQELRQIYRYMVDLDTTAKLYPFAHRHLRAGLPVRQPLPDDLKPIGEHDSNEPGEQLETPHDEELQA